MAIKKLYYLQLPQNYFNRLAQKKLRKQDDGLLMQVIYLKMLLAGLGNEGLILYQGIYDSLSEEIAEEIDEDPEVVQKAIDYLLDNHMAREVQDEEGGGMFFPESDELTGSESESAERVRRHRAKKKEKALHSDADVTESNGTVTESNGTVTESNGTVTECNDIKNKEKNIKEELNKRIKDSYFNSSLKEECDRAPASADAAGAVSLFTLEDFMECADENDLDMTEDEIRKCYQANRRKGFEPPKGKRSFSILGTLRGWHKNKAPAPDPEPAPAPKPKPKPKSKDEQIMEISRDYIPEELLEKYPDAKRTLTGAFCPKSAFLDRGREDLIEYLKDCGVWLSINPQGEKSPLYKNMITRMEG